MTLDERIYQSIQALPKSFQKELLDFAQYLLMKAERLESQEWSAVSLSSAMRGMEEEETLYALSDLKVVFE